MPAIENTAYRTVYTVRGWQNVGTTEDKVIMLLRQDSNLTAKTIAATLGLTDRQVERILSKLKSERKIVRHGASKNGYWEVQR
jgi:predicted HTH transcriptional regulator